MILKLLIAFYRWMWGISPAFYNIATPISDNDSGFMALGIFLDLVAVGALLAWLITRERKR